MNRTVRILIVVTAILLIAITSYVMGFGSALLLTTITDRQVSYESSPSAQGPDVQPAPTFTATAVATPGPLSAAVTPVPAAPRAATPSSTATVKDVQDRFALFWEALRRITDNYYDQSVIDPQKIVYGAISGAIESLGDQHTYFTPPEVLKRNQEDLEGAFEGIGATIEKKDDHLQIVAPIAGTPAQRAGLRAGDWIMKIDGKDATGLSVTEGVGMIRGKKGTAVILTIMRDGTPDPFEVSIVRDVINVPNVKLTMREGDVAHLQILNVFSANTTEDLKAALKDARQKGAKKAILDLRGNPGGYLRTSVEVASQFMKDGVVVSELTRDGKKTDLPVIRGGLATDWPLVVLVDKGSASASEIVAGAIQDSKRGILIGETTYGKGSVQQDFQLSDGSAVHVTIAAWLTPSGRSISKAGLKPDIEVKLTEDDIKANRDLQLDRALQYLTTGQ